VGSNYNVTTSKWISLQCTVGSYWHSHLPDLLLVDLYVNWELLHMSLEGLTFHVCGRVRQEEQFNSRLVPSLV